MTEGGLDRPQPQERRKKDRNSKASRQDRNMGKRMETGVEETPPPTQSLERMTALQEQAGPGENPQTEADLG